MFTNVIKGTVIVPVQVVFVNARKNAANFESGFKKSLTNEKKEKTLHDKITRTTAFILKKCK